MKTLSRPKIIVSLAKIAAVVATVCLAVFSLGYDKQLTGAFLTSTITIAGNPIGNSVTPPDACTPGEAWLFEVNSFSQGNRKNGTAIFDPNRTDPGKTLGTNDATSTSNFFSLGDDGVLIAQYRYPVQDGVGNDFSVYEMTNGRMSYPLETAEVAVSQDGVNWVVMPTPATSRVGGNGIASYDLTTVGVPWFQFIRITDTTDFGPHSAHADGFDVDAVRAMYGTCDSVAPPAGRSISGQKFHDDNSNGANDSELGLQNWTIYAATKISDLTVQAQGMPTVFTPTLESGVTYLLRVEGVYDANDSIIADAKYSVRSPNTTWTDSVQNYEVYGPTLLDLQIDGVSPSWGEFNTDHVYWIPVTGTGDAKALRIYDLDNGNNNSGSLSVGVFQVIAEDITDATGNYSLLVPLTSETIYVFEAMQNNWTQTLPGSAEYYYSTVVTDGSISRDFGNDTVSPTGTLMITKYQCSQSSVITTAQRPDASGDITVPAGCDLQSGARFGYIHQANKTDLSAPYPGLTDSTPFSPFSELTDISGELFISHLPSAGRYMLAELDDAGTRVADSEVLGFLCTGDAGTYTNNYEAAFIPEDGTAYCAVFNRVPNDSIVLNEILPDPAGDDGAAKPAGEWVELYNNSAFDIDVAGWRVYNAAGDSLVIETGNSDANGNPFDGGETVVPAGGYLVVYRNGDGNFSLNETDGDTVSLYDGVMGSGGTLLDTHTFEGIVAENKTIARSPDGVGAWVDPVPQPGRENIINLEDLFPFIELWKQDDNHAILGLFEGLNYDSFEYVITYKRDSEFGVVTDQLQGSLAITDNNLYLMDLFFGSTSVNEETGETNYYPHTGIHDIEITVILHSASLPDRQLTGAQMGAW